MLLGLNPLTTGPNAPDPGTLSQGLDHYVRWCAGLVDRSISSRICDAFTTTPSKDWDTRTFGYPDWFELRSRDVGVLRQCPHQLHVQHNQGGCPNRWARVYSQVADIRDCGIDACTSSQRHSKKSMQECAQSCELEARCRSFTWIDLSDNSTVCTRHGVMPFIQRLAVIDHDGVGSGVDWIATTNEMSGNFQISVEVFVTNPSNGLFESIVSRFPAQGRNGQFWNRKNGFNLQIQTDGNINFFMGNGADSTYGISIDGGIVQASRWTAISVHMLNNRASLFVDGKQVDSAQFKGGFRQTYATRPVAVGRYYSQMFSGKMRNLNIWTSCCEGDVANILPYTYTTQQPENKLTCSLEITLAQRYSVNTSTTLHCASQVQTKGTCTEFCQSQAAVCVAAMDNVFDTHGCTLDYSHRQLVGNTDRLGSGMYS